MIMLKIVREPAQRMWYSGKKGQMVPYCGLWPEAYHSREPAGYANRVEFSDAELWAVVIHGRCPTCGAGVLFKDTEATQKMTYGDVRVLPKGIEEFQVSRVPPSVAKTLKNTLSHCGCGSTLRLDLPHFEPDDLEGALGVKVYMGSAR